MRALTIVLITGIVSPCFGRSITVEAPPGWEDVTSADSPDLIASLKGPETATFVLMRVKSVPLSNRALVRTALLDVLAGINNQSNLGFSPVGGVLSATYKNDLTVHYLQAEFKGKPKLVLALMEHQSETLLATLMSAVPDTVMPSILGSLKSSSSPQPRPAAAGSAESLDGQLAFLLPEGVSARALGAAEKSKGVVFAAKGFGAEMVVIKISDTASSARDEAQTLKETILSVPGVNPASLSKARLIKTSAGPSLAYAWASREGRSQFSAGFLPWCYWGYSILVQGPGAERLLREVFQGASLGPTAVPGQVAATPAMSLSGGGRKKLMTAAFALGAAIVLGGAFLFGIGKSR